MNNGIQTARSTLWKEFERKQGSRCQISSQDDSDQYLPGAINLYELEEPIIECLNKLRSLQSFNTVMEKTDIKSRLSLFDNGPDRDGNILKILAELNKMKTWLSSSEDIINTYVLSIEYSEGLTQKSFNGTPKGNDIQSKVEEIKKVPGKLSKLKSFVENSKEILRMGQDVIHTLKEIIGIIKNLDETKTDLYIGKNGSI